MRNDLLKAVREEKFTLKELADAIGMSEAQLSRIENGKRLARVEELERLAQELGVSASIFLDDSGYTPAHISNGTASGKGSRAGAILITGAAIMGEVCARRWFEEGAAFCGFGEIVEAPAVPGRHHPAMQFAYKVSGDSMAGREIKNEDFVICVPYFEARDQIVTGDLVVIERKRGALREVSCREVSASGKRIEFASRPGRDREDGVVADLDLIEEGGERIELIGLVIGKYRPL